MFTSSGAGHATIRWLIDKPRRPTSADRSARIADRRRDDLIQAAFGQIAERGFEGLRTRDVAARAGVNVATLHYYFPTKEALIRGVLEYAMARFRSTLAPHGSPSDQLHNHLRAVRKLLQAEPRLGAVMAELLLRSARDESIQPIVAEMFEAWHGTMRGLLSRGVREGHLRGGVDSEGAAALVIATLMAQTLPGMAGRRRASAATRELERWLESSN